MPGLTRTVPRHVLLLVGILVLAAALRIYQIGANPLWFDEIATLLTTTGWGYRSPDLPRNVVIGHPIDPASLADARPIWRVWTALDRDPHPPLYYLLLRIWRELFGSSAAVVRLLGTVFSVLGVGLVFALGRDLGGTAVGAWAGLILAVAPPQVYFAQEARDYAMLGPMCLAAALALRGIERRGPSTWRAIALAVAALATMLTHYFGAGVLLALGIYALLRLRGRARLITCAMLVLAVLVFLGLWGRQLLHQRVAMTANAIGSAAGPATTLGRLGIATLRQLIGADTQSPAIAIAAIVLTVALVGLIWRRREMSLVWLWLLCTLGLLCALDLARGTGFLTLMRYTLAAAPAVALLVAGALVGRTSRAWHAIPLAAVVLALFFLPSAYRIWKAGWTDAGQLLEASMRPEDVLVIAPQDALGDVVTVYAGLRRDAPAVINARRRVVLLSRPADPALERQLAAIAPSLWLILQNAQDPPQSALPGARPTAQGIEIQNTANLGAIWRMTEP